MQLARLRWSQDRKAQARGGFWMFLIQIALFVAVELLRPKPEIEGAKPAGLGDFSFPTATEGRVVPIFWGTVRMDGPNVVWYGDLIQEAIVEKQQTGLFSSQRVTVGYKYKVGMQFAVSLGPVDSIIGMWIGDDKVWTGSVTHGNSFTINEPELFGGEEHGQGGFLGEIEFFSGTTTQTASTYLSTFQQQGGDTPAYRGFCYLAPKTLPFYVGNSTSLKPWKFELQRIPNGLSLATPEVNSLDCNPANMIYEIMTNKDWGLGYETSDIDTANFAAAAATLLTEGNGISYMVTSPIESGKLIRTVEEQIEGLVRFNQFSAKWEIKLARSDYTPGTLQEVNEDTMVELVDFGRGAWDGTTNQVRVQFADRTDEYKTTYAMAQDTANVRIQDVNVAITKNYPGVFDRTLANTLAWRDLRSLSYPLAKATLIVDRTFWDFLPGDVIEFSHTYLGIDRLPMRIKAIDFGEIDNGRIRLEVVQDVFYSATPSFSDPTTTSWTNPTEILNGFPSEQQLAFEAPRGLVRRDPSTAGALLNTVMAAARQSGSAISFDIRERHAAGVPTGAFTLAGEVVQFMKIGELNAALTTKSAYPLSTLLVTATPDTQDEIREAFITPTDTTELGTTLMNLVLVGDEFMLVTSASDNAANVDLNNVYRGVLDSVQADHASGDEVWILMSGAGLTDTSFPETDNVDVLLIPVGFSDELAEASATEIAFTMDKRIRRPYPPALLTLNGTDWDTTSVSLEGAGTGPEDYSITATLRRRDYRTADLGNEIAALESDAETLDATFPAAHATDHDIVVTHDPSGTNDAIITETIAGATQSLLRIDVLTALSGAVPTGDLQWSVLASHTDGGETLTSRQALVHSASIATGLTGYFEFGLRSINTASATYTATVNGTYGLTLSSAFTAGAVEARINGGGWASIIAAGLTTGNIAGVVSTDTIEIRHTSNDAGIKKQLTMAAAGAGQNAFAIFQN
tara:strand:+ start:7716 stop:10622 length:2907 start_codon:yes stop_codon:yes gene_type:complete